RKAATAQSSTRLVSGEVFMAAEKVALVTGSGKRRVGAYVVEALARRGYAIVIHYRSSAADAIASAGVLQTQGGQAIALQAELTDEQSVRGLVQQVLDRFGRFDVLVNTAAIWKAKRLEDVTAADVRQFLETNTLATFLCCQHAGLAMVGQPEGGCIVTFG